VAFTPYTVNGKDARLLFSLSCSGNGTLLVELWQADSPLAGWGSLSCGVLGSAIRLPAGLAYALRLSPAAGAGLQLVSYTLTVENLP
jgi:hypothetical protein